MNVLSLEIIPIASWFLGLFMPNQHFFMLHDVSWMYTNLTCIQTNDLYVKSSWIAW